ncbi:adhesion G-protein coupled receptor G2-like isoform X2 [Catharus ustulatus]|uniref:adhesion G-protein coupled receptor G2-like isoform X2 n=1 Tax=Catharus ustulatus TaxID=91951 RepID=UPI0014080B9D|nr:adhesion G-protein coupled receptor G2-like isoform X2 [Catharus ustulatus]
MAQTVTRERKVRTDNPSKILLNFCAALLMLNIVILTDSWLTAFNQPGLRITVATLLRYLLLALFMWMCLESVHFYLALVKVFNVCVPKYILKCGIADWGFFMFVFHCLMKDEVMKRCRVHFGWGRLHLSRYSA